MEERSEITRSTMLYFSAFLFLGMAAAVLGPSLLQLREQTDSSLEMISIIFPIRAGAYLLGSWLAGGLYDRFSGHRLLAYGLLGMGSTLALVPQLSSLPILLPILLLMGLSMGMVDVGCNTLLLALRSRNVSSYMNGLHFFYGLGSFAAPLVLAESIGRRGGIDWGYRLLGLVSLLVLLQIWRLPSPNLSSQDRDPGRTARSVEGSAGRGLLILIVLFFFFYVGVEVGFGNWISTFSQQVRLADERTGALLTSAFWGAFTAGRLLSIPLASRLSDRSMLRGDLWGGMVGLGLITLLPGESWAVWSGTVLLGFSLASVFPTMLSLADRMLALSGKTTSWFFVSGGLGAVFFPWMIGLFVGRAGAMLIIYVLLSLLAASGGCFFSIIWLGKKKIPTENSADYPPRD